MQADFARARQCLGVVPQELVFDPFFNVRETLRLQSGYFGVKNNDAWIDELLESLGLADKATANMRQLSGGMKRRVLVAQALVHKPPIIVLDEPTAGVDVELRQTLWQFIAQAQQAGPHGAAHHPLPGGGRGAVRAHRHAQERPRGGARQHLRAAAERQRQRAAVQDRCAAGPRRWRGSRA
ncbi:ATP-binding protein [Alicycliphilus sp. B1]|nr:ATP-binding protein [Alicycliphilus sp. B1]